MIIEKLEVAGIMASLEAMRLPHRSAKSTDSEWDWEVADAIRLGPNDKTLAQKLIGAGSCHSKFTRGIVAWFKTTGPWYWFNELDTYCVGRTPLSSTSSMHTECKGLTGEELQAAKANIRGDYEYTRIWTANYQCLRNMYHQRKHHRLPEWGEMCRSIETLPLAKELILI